MDYMTQDDSGKQNKSNIWEIVLQAAKRLGAGTYIYKWNYSKEYYSKYAIVTDDNKIDYI